MSKYRNVKVAISHCQKEKLRAYLESGAESVSIKLNHQDLKGGNDVLALTNAQVNKLTKAYQSGKGVTIKLSKTQLAHNLKVEGGFLGILASLAARALPMLVSKVLPALGIGALTGLASTGVQKVMGKGTGRLVGAGRLVGNGLYLKKGGAVCQIETDGKGLYLSPSNGSGLADVGDGLYLKKQGGIVDGSGLLLGQNSPFKNIPILGMIL